MTAAVPGPPASSEPGPGRFRRHLLGLWVEAYGQSLVDPGGPWAGFAAQTVQDWLELLASRQPRGLRRSASGAAQRTAVLAVLRGAMLDLLATSDTARASRAVEQLAAALRSGSLG